MTLYEHHHVLYHRRHDCLFMCFRCLTTKEISKPHLLSVFWGIGRRLVDSLHTWNVMRKVFPCHDVIMSDACATRNFTYLVRDPWLLLIPGCLGFLGHSHISFIWKTLSVQICRHKFVSNLNIYSYIYPSWYSTVGLLWHIVMPYLYDGNSHIWTDRFYVSYVSNLVVCSRIPLNIFLHYSWGATKICSHDPMWIYGLLQNTYLLGFF